MRKYFATRLTSQSKSKIEKMPTVIHASQGIRNGPLAAFRNTTNGIVREKRPSRGVMRISKISGRSVQAVQVNRLNLANNRRDASENVSSFEGMTMSVPD